MPGPTWISTTLTTPTDQTIYQDKCRICIVYLVLLSVHFWPIKLQSQQFFDKTNFFQEMEHIIFNFHEQGTQRFELSYIGTSAGNWKASSWAEWSSIGLRRNFGISILINLDSILIKGPKVFWARLLVILCKSEDY